MFGLFKRKTELEKLINRYEKLTEEAFNLSHTNRKLGDEKLAEAEAIKEKIERLNNTEGKK